MAKQIWRSGEGERRWLSTLIDAMEKVSRPEFRATPCDPKVFSALRLQLARPKSRTVKAAWQRRPTNLPSNEIIGRPTSR